MQWKDVVEGLTPFLGTGSGAWLGALTEENGGHQLAICLYIDLLAKRIAPDDVAAVVTRVDAHARNPVKEFGLQLDAWERTSGRTHFYSRLRNGGSHEPCSYARVLELGAFIRRYVTPNTGVTLEPVDARRVRRLYFGKKKGVPLGKVKRAWHGGRDRTWVLPGHEVDPVLRSEPRDATTLVNRLGLYVSEGIGDGGKPHMVCVRYPDGQPLKAVQPTAFDADWTQGRTFFLSCGGKQGWGQSHSLTGDREGCPELVHGPLARLTGGHVGHEVGLCESIETNPESIMKDAYTRLDEVAMASASESVIPELLPAPQQDDQTTGRR